MESDSEDEVTVFFENKLGSDDTKEGEVTMKSEVETDTEVAENWPMAGSECCSGDESGVKRKVKIEIDVAAESEDPSLYWGMNAEQHTHGSGKDNWPIMSETASIHMKSTPPSPATLIADGREWLKQEVADQSNGSHMWIKQEAADQSSDNHMWIKQEAADPSTEPFGFNPDSEPNSGEGSGISYPAEHEKQTGVDCSTPWNATVTERRSEKLYVCQQCAAVFTHSSNLKRHMLIHTGEKPHVCQQCDVGFITSCSLKRHIVVHTEERPHKCSQCSAAFRHPFRLKQHSLIHTGEKPHACHQCDAAFRHTFDLKRHMLIHTGDKPHKCSQCSAAFTKSSKLKQHILIHTGEKPHKCVQCGAAFNDPSTLKQHILIHTGEKPRKCSECSAAFRYSFQLKKHAQIHTQEKETA